jgi:flagellar motor switch protein FliN/FliY
MEQNEATKMETKDTDAGENLSWDDVQDELKETSKTDISMANFDEIPKSEKKGQTSLDIDFILDIPLTLTVELGKSRMLISDLLQLGQGSIVELSKIAGEPMEVYVNQRLIARGEVVVVNEKFGVRLTDIISPAERINKLK